MKMLIGILMVFEIGCASAPINVTESTTEADCGEGEPFKEWSYQYKKCIGQVAQLKRDNARTSLITKMAEAREQGKRDYETAEKQAEVSRVKAEASRVKEIKNYTAKYPNRKAYEKKMLNKQLWIGMTESELRLSLGRPNSVNRTTTLLGERKQYVYSLGRYVYVNESRVIYAWQD